MNNDWWDYLAHAKSEEREGHKYIARVQTGTKNGKNVFRYFYTNDEYKAWMKDAKAAISNAGSKAKAAAGAAAKAVKTASATVVSDVAKETKEFYDTIKDKVEDTVEKKKEKKARNELRKEMEEAREKAKKEEEAAEKEGFRVTVKDKDETTTFNSMDAYERYLKKTAYQKNEPKCMKSLKHQNAMEMSTETSDVSQAKANAGEYSPYDGRRSLNCMYCSTAYELRQRGYDVESKEWDYNYTGYLSNMNRWFEDAVTYKIDSKSKEPTDVSNALQREADYLKLVEEEPEKANDPETTDYFYTKEYLSAYESGRCSGQDIVDGIAKVSPKNSRGYLTVYWKGGGGHSMAYEVDASGNVIIRDCQSNEVYDAKLLASHVNNVYVTRTDNLTPTEYILEAVQNAS